MQDDNSNLPELPTPDLSGFESDSQAGKEEQNFKRLDELSKAKHENSLTIHKTIRFLIPLTITLAFIGFSALSVSYLLNVLLPEQHRWLSPDEVTHIHSIIFSSIVGGAVALLSKLYLGDPKKD